MDCGTVVADRFELIELAARGGTGAVFRARDRATGTFVAFKRIDAMDDANRIRFEREASVLAELVHPRIAGYVAHGTHDMQSWLAMRWVDGVSLHRHLRTVSRLSAEDTIRVLRGAAEGLSIAHQSGVVHRDVKPGNLLLEDGDLDRVVVVDFGIARRLLATVLTPHGACIGTPGYMSPEQVRGEETIDPRADVFSMGAVAFRCLTGRTAFTGPNPMSTLAKVLFEDPPDIADIAPHVPHALAALVMRMLDRDREKRPRDAKELLECLDALDIESVPPSAKPVLGHEETRVFCAVAALLEEHDEHVWTQRAQQLRMIAEPFSGRFEPISGGAAIIALDPVGSAIDQMLRTKRLAQQLYDTGIPRAVAVAMGRGSLHGTRVVGAVIDEVIELLRQPGPPIRVTESIASLDRRTRSPCVGRDRELRLIDGAVIECIQEKRAQTIVIVGPSGSGKTRLRQKMEETLEGTTEWLVRGDELGRHAPLAAMGALLRTLAPDGDFDALAARTIPSEARRIAPYLAEIAGMHSSSGMDRVARGDELQRAFVDFVWAHVEKAPLALVLEDAHYLDLASLKLVHQTIASLEDHPLLVAIFARNDAEDALRPFERGLRIALGDLNARACKLLARHLAPSASEEAVDRIATASNGNPLMMEELARAHSNARVPETVFAMMEARLGELPSDVRRTLRAASVLGTDFDAHAIAAIVGDINTTEATRSLEIAARYEIVSEGWMFRHALLREAAYATLTPSDRVSAHDRAARWLERNHADPIRIAEHWERADRIEKAIPFLTLGAERALAASDTDACLALVTRAIAAGANEELGRLHLFAAEALSWQARYVDARERAERAMYLLPAGSATWHAAATEAIVAAGRTGNEEGVLAIAERIESTKPAKDAIVMRMIALARAASALAFGTKRDTAARIVEALDAIERSYREIGSIAHARVEESRANLALAHGDRGAYVTSMGSVARSYEEGGALRAACMTRMNLGHVLTSVGAWEASVYTLESALAAARALRIPFLVTAAEHNLGLALAYAGRSEEGERIEREALVAAIQRNDTRLAGACRMYLARIALLRNDPKMAEREARLAARHLDPHPALAAIAHATHALAALQCGNEDAMASADRAWSILASRGELEEGDALVRLARIETLLAVHRTDEARAILEEARARIVDDMHRLHESMRAPWLAVPEHARILALCGILAS